MSASPPRYLEDFKVGEVTLTDELTVTREIAALVCRAI